MFCYISRLSLQGTSAATKEYPKRSESKQYDSVLIRRVRPFLARINLQTQPLFLCWHTGQSKSHEGSLSISLFHTAQKILLTFISQAAWQHWYYSTKVGHWRNDVLEGHAPFHFNFFLQKMFARLTLQFPSTYICICNRVRSVSFSDGEFRDRDMIFRDETDLVFCFLSCLVKFPALEVNSKLAFFHD